MSIELLTLEDLDSYLPKTIFRTIETGDVRYVATRGGIGDWAIYKGPLDWDFKRIYDYGIKVVSKDLIRTLISCTDDAFARYRF